MANWKKVLVSGSAIEVRNITASGLPESSGGSDKIVVIDISTGRLAYTSSAAGGGGGIFTDQGTYYNTENTLQVTSSTAQVATDVISTTANQPSARYALLVSESAHFYNHNVGVPSSNAWGSNLDGSYFNNFNSNTDVSEILRFVAGLLSASAPNASPNTRTFTTPISSSNNNTQATRGTTTFPDGNIPLGTTDEDVIYTITKGFSAYGSKLYEEVEDNANGGIFNDPDYYTSYTSVADGSTTVSSDAGDPELVGFGLLSSPGVQVRINVSRFWDHDGTTFTLVDATPGNGGANSSSFHYFNNSTPDTVAEGIEINTIQTVNPAVIPAAYIDGKFTNLIPEYRNSNLFREGGTNIGGHNSQSISSSGWYKNTYSFAIYTGSQTSDAADALSTGEVLPHTIFWSPIGQPGVFSTLTAQLSNDVSFSGDIITSGSFTSRSLSGAPYLNGAVWNYYTTASNAFKPMYSNDSTLTSETIAVSDFLEDSTYGTDITTSDISASGFTATTQNSSTGVITNAGTVYVDTTDQNGSVPNIEAQIYLEKTETLNFGGTLNGTDTNTTLVTSDAVSDEIDVSFTVQKITTSGTEGSSTKTFSHRPHLAGHFDQPASSGSMLLFASSDGDDQSSQSTTVGLEKFTGEANRRTIGDCTTVGELSNAFDSGSRLSDNTPRDTQVKPGYLVIPGSTYGYWYPSYYYSTSNYYWYLREFDFGTPGSPSQMAVSITGASTTPSSITGLDDTSTANTLSIGFIFESGIAAGAGGRTNIVDITKAISSDIATSNSNPFTSNINLVGWTGGSVYSSGNATIVFSEAANTTINNTYSKVWALVRMRGTANGSNGLEKLQLTVS